VTTDSKRYIRGVARAGHPLVGTDHYVALADCNRSQRKCDRNCGWPHCSPELTYCNKKADCDKKCRELRQLGHTVEWEEVDDGIK